MVDSKQGVKVTVNVPPVDLPPEAANWFHFSLSNLDLQMLVGYIDPRDAFIAEKAVRSGKGPEAVTPLVGHRFVMSLSGFARLKAQVTEIEQRMRSAGVPMLDAALREAVHD